MILAISIPYFYPKALRVMWFMSYYEGTVFLLHLLFFFTLFSPPPPSLFLIFRQASDVNLMLLTNCLCVSYWINIKLPLPPLFWGNLPSCQKQSGVMMTQGFRQYIYFFLFFSTCFFTSSILYFILKINRFLFSCFFTFLDRTGIK